MWDRILTSPFFFSGRMISWSSRRIRCLACLTRFIEVTLMKIIHDFFRVDKIWSVIPFLVRRMPYSARAILKFFVFFKPPEVKNVINFSLFFFVYDYWRRRCLNLSWQRIVWILSKQKHVKIVVYFHRLGQFEFYIIVFDVKHSKRLYQFVV